MADCPDILSDKSPRDLKFGNRPVLVAVSGGSDSVALLHWLVEEFPSLILHVATVDHQLRTESAEEAATVAEMCGKLNVPHTTLVWDSLGPASSATSRSARYDLLHRHAVTLDAAAIVLGHTINDQAETVFMRAQRTLKDSDTRGLAGIVEWSTNQGIRLWRPLLSKSRAQLREYLKQRQISWMDDPSNLDHGYERIRVRNTLASTVVETPSISKVALLGTLSAKTRGWMNQQVANALQHGTQISTDGAITFLPDTELPRPVMLEVLAVLILIVGGQAFRVPTSKLTKVAEAICGRQVQKVTLGRCLITIRGRQVCLQRENRNLPPFPAAAQEQFVYDGRIRVQPATSGAEAVQVPHISSLEGFRPQVDDCLYNVIMELLDSAPRST